MHLISFFDVENESALFVLAKIDSKKHIEQLLCIWLVHIFKFLYYN